MIVYRPFKGEIIMGTITNSDPQDGIFLSTEFFDDIQVPPSVLPEHTVYDPEQELFIWKYPDDNDPEQITEYYFDKAEKCLMRVEQEQFNDINANPDNDEPEAQEDDSTSRASLLKKAPYSLQCSMMHAGTGPKLWWIDAAVDEDGDVVPDEKAGETV